MVRLCSRCGGGGTGDRPRRCTLVEGGPCAACEEGAAIYHQIKQLEKEILELKEKRRVLATTMNANHDPFIHKFPPEIGSHIFRLCLPSLHSQVNNLWVLQMCQKTGWAVPLKLGAVCRKWRQLAWATSNLWQAPLLRIHPCTTPSLAKALPDLLREWLGRSGLLPLHIFFGHDGYLEEGSSAAFLNSSEKRRLATLKTATELMIKVLNSQQSRFGNLRLRMDADMFDHLSRFLKPKKIIGLELEFTSGRGSMEKFITESNPTYLTLIGFPLESIDMGWDNVTHAVLGNLYLEEYLEVLRRAPALEYLHVIELDINPHAPILDFNTVFLHPQLRLLNSADDAGKFLEAINVPSLEEWTHNMGFGQGDCAIMISLLERSNCSLKVLNLQGQGFPQDFYSVLQAMPSLQRLTLLFMWESKDRAIMDDILTRISHTTSDSRVSSAEGPILGSFLPHLLFLECGGNEKTIFPFTWDRIPELYYQGHRHSLTLSSRGHGLHISDETALKLLHLVEEGVDLQIHDSEIGEDFLENFRNRMNEESR